MRILTKVILTFCFLNFALFASAESSITIQDTSGFTRAVSEVQHLGKVEFNLVDDTGKPASGFSIQLLNSTTGETLSAEVLNGSAAIEGVSPGVWTVSTSAPGITFTSVTVTGLAVAGGGATATLSGAALIALGGTAVAAGTTIAIVEANDNNDDNDMPVSPFH